MNSPNSSVLAGRAGIPWTALSERENCSCTLLQEQTIVDARGPGAQQEGSPVPI